MNVHRKIVWQNQFPALPSRSGNKFNVFYCVSDRIIVCNLNLVFLFMEFLSESVNACGVQIEEVI